MLTSEKVLSMKPGRELDALIAEKVMGYRCEVDKGNGCIRWLARGAYGEEHTPPMAWKKWGYKVPPYSTDIAAAWEVVEKMHEWGGCEIGCYGKKTSRWFVVSTFTDTQRQVQRQVNVTSKTATEAISKAALLAVMDNETN